MQHIVNYNLLNNMSYGEYLYKCKREQVRWIDTENSSSEGETGLITRETKVLRVYPLHTHVHGYYLKKWKIGLGNNVGKLEPCAPLVGTYTVQLLRGCLTKLNKLFY